MYDLSYSHIQLDAAGSASQSALGGPSCTGAKEHILIVEKMDKDPVGFGGYSDVWRGKMIKGGGFTVVALKVLRPMGADPDRTRKRLEREVLCWKPLHHDNIAPFYGVVQQPNSSHAIVSPWYKNGTANVYLKSHPAVHPLKITWEIAAGIEYLHEMGVVHGDLKGANVMIDDEGHAKLIDFGLSRLIDSDPGLTTSTTSSVRWCAPELLWFDDARTTKASDVYAFASTTLELLTGDVPYSKIRAKNAVYRTVLTGLNSRHLSNDISYAVSCQNLLWQILEHCWTKASHRPTISEVKQRMRNLDN